MISGAAARLLAFRPFPRKANPGAGHGQGTHQRTVVLLALAGCASDYNPSRPYSSDEVRQLALEDLARRSLSFEEYQAKRQAILEEKPQTAVSQSNAALRSTAI